MKKVKPGNLTSIATTQTAVSSTQKLNIFQKQEKWVQRISDLAVSRLPNLDKIFA